jgi:hypothetical protein
MGIPTICKNYVQSYDYLKTGLAGVAVGGLRAIGLK